MEDFALIFDVQRDRIIAISEAFLRQIKKGKNHQMPSEQYGFWTRTESHSVELAVGVPKFSVTPLTISNLRLITLIFLTIGDAIEPITASTDR